MFKLGAEHGDGARVRFSLAVMWTHLFFAKYFLQNSVTLPLPGYKVSTLQSGTKLYLDTVWTQHYFLPVPRHQYLGKCEQTPLRQPC